MNSFEEDNSPLNDDRIESKPRKVRKTGIWKPVYRFKEFIYLPISWYDQMIENLKDVLEDKKWLNLASQVICISLNIMLWLVSVNYLNKFFGGVALLSISVVNMINFLTKTKSYQLLRHNARDYMKSPRVKATTISLDDTNEHFTEIAELEVWNPAYITTQVFTFFSPLQVILVLAFEGRDRFSMLGGFSHFILGAFVGLVLRVVISSYQGLLQDREIVFREVYDEFNSYAVSRLSVIKYSQGVQTDPSTAGISEKTLTATPSRGATASLPIPIFDSPPILTGGSPPYFMPGHQTVPSQQEAQRKNVFQRRR